MSVCSRARLISPGQNILQSRWQAFPRPWRSIRLSSGLTRDTHPDSSYDKPSRSRPDQPLCPVPGVLRHEPEAWIQHLEKYIPKGSSGSTLSAPEATRRNISECEEILDLLYHARMQKQFDLLTILGFKYRRWQAFHALIIKLLDYATLARVSSKKGQLPSNINWGDLGSFNTVTNTHLPLDPADIRFSIDGIPVSSFGSYSEEPMMCNAVAERPKRTGVMDQLWQSLGTFVIEAAELPSEESSAVMSHFYRVLARLHHLEMIPPAVYMYTPKKDPALPNRPPGMHLLSYPIMSIISEAAWEAEAVEQLRNSADPDTSRTPQLRYISRKLGFSVWLEFVLWCCVEGGFAMAASWILNKSQKCSESWRIASWAELQRRCGSIDTLKMVSHDTWASCGELSNISNHTASTRPFLGMGPQTITKEVVDATIDGLMNGMRVSVNSRGNPLETVWGRANALRAILKENKLSLAYTDIVFLIVRDFESRVMAPETEPKSVERLLKLAQKIRSEDMIKVSHVLHPEDLIGLEDDRTSSGLVLGLFHYLLNTYASSGHVSGTIDVFERLLMAVDHKKVKTIRKWVLDPIYRLKAEPVRTTSRKHPMTLHMSPVSWTLLLDNLTFSRLYALANWITKTFEETLMTATTTSRDGTLITDALIRLATATEDQSLYAKTAVKLSFPLKHQSLVSLLNWRIGQNDWEGSSELFHYLQQEKKSQWDIANITFLAASIVRLESKPLGKALFENPVQEESPDGALRLMKDLLIGVLSGKYNQGYRQYGRLCDSEAALNQLYNIFRSIPGSLSDVCNDVKLQWNRPHEPSYRISANAFNHLLAAVVDTRGSAAGKLLWDRFCIEPLDPEEKRAKSRNSRSASIIMVSLKSIQIHRNKTHLVLPDLTTVRIITQAALNEKQVFEERGSYPRYPSAYPLTTTKPTAESCDAILAWGSEMFERYYDDAERDLGRELHEYQSKVSEATLAATAT